VLDERATDAAPPVGGSNRHLLDVRVTGDQVDDDISDRSVAAVDRHPRPPRVL